ncbi:adipor receptor [Hyphodiscus hymeniophilus]|uniref:Adipor receptor n=1 Tax=Hyphodiscus hymeniophilus TaxID=353542 RepID=A0A9P6VLN9_9HELO|nr:adipor receptor [Hyphodiscus hymeniophilus]
MSGQKRKASTKEAVVDIAKNIEQKAEKAFTVLWSDLPHWQQDNHYIQSGYRPASYSFQKSFSSLGYLHNESVNIYSHLIGAVLFSISGTLLYALFKSRYESATSSDILAFGCFFLGAALCLGMSATYHAISNHSPTVARWGNKLDYICSLGMGCAAVSIFDRFRTPAWRPYRAGMFVLMGLSAVIPVLHGVELYGIQEMRGRIGLSWLVLQGFLYILGAGLYAARWPERSSPGSFDIWGSSHQIFHVLVVMAAASHLYGLLKAFDYHHGLGGFKC